MNLQTSTPPAVQYGQLGNNFLSQGLFGMTSMSSQGVGGFPSNAGSSSFLDASPTEIGLGANKSVVYHYAVKRTDQSFLTPGAVMFVLRDPRIYGEKCASEVCFAQDFYKLNQWLKAKHQSLRNCSAEFVANLWKICGVVKHQVNGVMSRQNDSIVMNNVVGQRASTVNVWGEQAREGTRLYFIVKKDGEGFWRFVPFASCDKDHPHLQDLEYKDKMVGNKTAVTMDKEGTATQYGAYIFVGTAISSPMACVEGSNGLFSESSFFAGAVDVCIGV